MPSTSTSLRNRQVSAVTDALVGGVLELFAGDPPPSAEYPAPEPLVTVQLAWNPFYPPIDGVAHAQPLPVTEILRDGRASWFRLHRDLDCYDGRCSLPGEGGELILDDIELRAGNLLEISDLRLVL